MTTNFVSLSKKIEGRMESIRMAIDQAAQDSGVDFSYLMAQARCESGLNPHAKAQGSTAAGLFQFLNQSWLGVLKQHGDEYGYGWAADAISREGGRWVVHNQELKSRIFELREEPAAAAAMAGAFAADNAQKLKQCLGRPASRGELYFAHFLGAAGASRFLTKRAADGNACAALPFPKEAKANRAVFYTHEGKGRSFDEVYHMLASRLDRNANDADSEWLKKGNLHYAAHYKVIPDRFESPQNNARLISLAMQGVDGMTAAAMLSHRPNTHSATNADAHKYSNDARMAYALISSSLSNI
ncbi:transglycosylase SLT domain-containing protein [Zymomonas mobilis]|uniref:transglycosylase SLT domain-containing protein n=1 Tax=Zymomonas mobilis TaxID=542 RepID=UPI000ECAA511|nr:transglycosylase SLT domain-containing protein [Zymomonas mobilis]HCE38062.1 lytic transglycosylase [Zymomonas mobilis]